MKKLFSFSLVLLCCFNWAQAQIISVVSPTNETKNYTDFKKAITEAPAGSMVYLPGGTFSGNGEIEIAKNIHIIGVGYEKSVNPIAGETSIGDMITFLTGADGSTLTGVQVGYVNIGKADGTNFVVNNLLIKQCLINSLSIRNAKGQLGGTGVFLEQNKFTGEVALRTKKATIINNLFLKTNGTNINYPMESVIKNNVFFSATPIRVIPEDVNNDPNIGNNVDNNIFVEGITDGFTKVKFLTFKSNIICNATVMDGNFSNVNKNSLFKPNTFQLQDNSVGKNKGTDGKDLGVYGGSSTWIEGGIP
ncbi:MAG: hypothetical protein RL662_682, partial [Bacteroidota bacterium]